MPAIPLWPRDSRVALRLPENDSRWGVGLNVKHLAVSRSGQRALPGMPSAFPLWGRCGAWPSKEGRGRRMALRGLGIHHLWRLPVVQKETQHPASPGIVLRRPRREGVFHPSGVVALSGVRVGLFRSSPGSLGFGQSHTWWLPFTRSLSRSIPSPPRR